MEPLLNFSSFAQAYWCHQCKKEFLIKKTNQQDIEIFCLNCKSDFCEEMVSDNENDPKNFVPYEYTQVSSESPENIDNTSRNGILEQRRRALEDTFNYFSQRLLDRYIDHLILRLMMRDPNRTNKTPACKKFVENLPLIKFTKEEIEKQEYECSVCKELFKENEEIKQIPCKHNFHNECLSPWLDDHNSCPICRYSLPLEIKETEEKQGE